MLSSWEAPTQEDHAEKLAFKANAFFFFLFFSGLGCNCERPPQNLQLSPTLIPITLEFSVSVSL